MFSIIDQQLYLATQQYADQFRDGSLLVGRSGRRRRLSSSDSPGASRPTSQESLTSALSRADLKGALNSEDGIVDRTGNVYLTNDGNGPIIATPMGMVRPWPRGGGCGKSIAAGPERQPDGHSSVEPPESVGSVTSVGIFRPGERRARRTDKETGVESDDLGLVVSTPMGNVRPTRLGSTEPRTTRSENIMNRLREPPVGNGERKPRQEEGNVAESNTKDGEGSGSRSLPPGSRGRSLLDHLADQGGHAPFGPRGPGFRDGYNRQNLVPRHSPSPSLEAPRQPSSPEPSPPELSPQRAATTGEENDLKNMTSLTLLTENLVALTTFYTDIFGAALTTFDDDSATLTFTPGLAVILRTSKSARADRAFGDGVALGSTAFMPKRAMMGVKVGNVDAVWRRLRLFGVGQAADDGAETLGEVRMVGAKKSVCFVDLSGHCWEAWQLQAPTEFQLYH